MAPAKGAIIFTVNKTERADGHGTQAGIGHQDRSQRPGDSDEGRECRGADDPLQGQREERDFQRHRGALQFFSYFFLYISALNIKKSKRKNKNWANIKI